MNKYKIRITSITTMEVIADTENDAIDIAVESADEYDSDIESEILEIEEDVEVDQ